MLGSAVLHAPPPRSPSMNKTELGMGPEVPYGGGCPSCRRRHSEAQGGQALEEPHSRHLCLCQLHPILPVRPSVSFYPSLQFGALHLPLLLIMI